MTTAVTERAAAVIVHPSETRAGIAARLKELMREWTANTLAISAELAAAAETFPVDPKRPSQRPGFAKWAHKHTGLSQSAISNLLLVNRKFGHYRGVGQLAGKVMILLARVDVPESARLEVVGRAQRGEHIGAKEAKKIADKHKLPSPKAANQQAKEEGRPVFASDGYIYFGTDPGKAKEGTDRRRMVYGVKDALEHLASIHLTARQFLDYAFPHQLWKPEEAPVIKKALRWLSDLDEAWEARKS